MATISVRSTAVVWKGDQAGLFPGLTQAANGDLLVSFCTQFDCLPGSEGFLLRSTDQARTWSVPRLMVQSTKPDGSINLSVGLTTLRDGTVLYPCCDARLTRKWDQHEADLMVLRSEDHGHTWSAPVSVPTEVKEPFAYGKILELASGDLLLPIWGKRIAEEPWRTGVLRSQDRGHTWGDYATIGYDAAATLPPRADAPAGVHAAGYNEATLAAVPDGRLVAILRQHGVRGGRRELDRSVSTDGGRTWSTPTRLPLWGTSPSIHALSSGAMVLGYRNHHGNPQGLPTSGVGLSLSWDGGETWAGHQLLPDPQGYVYRHDFDAGYPAFLDLPDGQVLVVYYSFDPLLPQERYLASAVFSVGPVADAIPGRAALV